MNKATKKMFETGVFEQKYAGVIEIRPRRVINSRIFDAALTELEKDYDLIQIFPGWIRAFKKGGSRQ